MKKDCLHPYWQEEHDGHHSQGWTCTGCGEYSWIAPWVLRRSDNYDDIGL